MPAASRPHENSCLRAAIWGFNARSSRTIPSIMASWISGHVDSSLLQPPD